jgi:hypothetical protein
MGISESTASDNFPGSNHFGRRAPQVWGDLPDSLDLPRKENVAALGRHFGKVQFGENGDRSFIPSPRIPPSEGSDFVSIRSFLDRTWLPDMGSNHDWVSQSHLCYHYTIGQ